MNNNSKLVSNQAVHIASKSRNLTKKLRPKSFVARKQVIFQNAFETNG